MGRRPASSSPTEIVDAVIQRLGPARNQQDTQLCFAHAVADAVTWHTGERVSAFSVAIRNFQQRRGLDAIFFQPSGVIASQTTSASRFMMGLASSALSSSLQATLCPEDQPAGNLTYRDQHLKEFWDVYHGKYRPYFGPTAPTHLYAEMESSLRKIAPGLNAEDFPKHLSRYQPTDEALGRWLDRQCSIRIQEKLSVVGSEAQLRSADTILQSLNRSLDRGEPAVVHYDPNVLFATTGYFWEKVIGFHVSLIAARADVGGETRYLLRNSWGGRCDYYASPIRERCDRGHIWLTEKEIREAVTSVAHFARE